MESRPEYKTRINSKRSPGRKYLHFCENNGSPCHERDKTESSLSLESQRQFKDTHTQLTSRDDDP